MQESIEDKLVLPQNDYMLGALLRIPFQALVEKVHAALTEAGHGDLTPSHLVLFQHLPPSGERPSRLAESAQITKQSMGYLADFLESRGYLERTPDPQDKRARLVQLTKKGRDVERVARLAIAEETQKWAEHLGAERMADLQASLREIVSLTQRPGSAG